MHQRLNWLFVVLDSSQDVQATERYLSPKMQEHNIPYEYRPEGLWFFGGEVLKRYIRDEVAVPFSACYIFDGKTKDCPKPDFKMKILERAFTDVEVRLVSDEIKRLNAIAYAADGGGLQLVSIDRELIRLVRQGFTSLEEVIRKQE